jgi:Leucine-rich repeat (LRR) protein
MHEVSRQIRQGALNQGYLAPFRWGQPLPTNQLTLNLLNNAIPQIDLALKEAPNGRLRYFVGNEETLQPKIQAKPSTLLTLPTGTNFDLSKLIFKPEIAKHKNKHRK